MCYTIFMTILVTLLSGKVILSEPQVPCMFIFGDALVDSGNTNILLNLEKANYPPYGIDFAGGCPTGRFTNGLTTADFITEFLGFDGYIPPFATTTGRNVLRGVNYASSGAGIREDTGFNLGVRLSFNQQLRNHNITISSMATLLGSRASAQTYLNKCLYYVGFGSDDYVNNYLLPLISPTRALFTPEGYADVLVQQYSQQLTTLYNSGARKVAVIGLLPIQIAPAAAALGNQTFIAYAVRLFDNRLVNLIDDLNKNLSNGTFILVNMTTISQADLSSVGIKVVDTPCCLTIPPLGLCVPLLIPCQNRSEYFFYDGAHPTDALNNILALKAYNSSASTDNYPFNISRLAQM